MVNPNDIKHLKVLTANNTIYTHLTDIIKSKVTKSDIFVITKDNWEKVSLGLKHKPLFSPYFIVEIYMSDISKSLLKDIVYTIKENHIQAIFNCTSIRDYEDLNSYNDDISILEYNGYNPPDRVMIGYLQERLDFHVTVSIYFELRNRLRGHYHLLDYYLEKINIEKATTANEIKKIVPKLSKLGLWRFFILLLNNEEPKRVFKLVNEYEYGGKFLLKYIQDNIESMIVLYKDYYKGVFNRKTVRSYIVKHSETLKTLGVRDYQLEDILTAFENHSFQEILLLKEIVDKAIQQQKSNPQNTSYILYQTISSIMRRKTYSKISMGVNQYE